jgi:hypothetical protein
MGIHQKFLNERQTELAHLLSVPDQRDLAVELFLQHHASLHSAQITQPGVWSFEDEVLDGLTENQFRRIPQNGEHSIAWNIWHLARIEDTAMNLLVAGGPQVLQQGNWLAQMKITARDTGNEMSLPDIARLSAEIDLNALRAYRQAVGRRTREIVSALQAPDFRRKVDPTRIAQVLTEGAVLESARYITDYWGKRTIAGLLLMPATRHNIVHLNEVTRLRQKR